MEEQEQLFEEYLAGKLAPVAQEDFEQQLATNPAFAEEFRIHLAAKYAVLTSAQQAEIHELSSRFEETSKRTFNQRAGSFPVKRLVVAAIVILVGLGFLFLWPSAKPTPQELYAQHFTPLPAPEIRGALDSTLQEWKSAVALYDEGKWKLMASQTEQLLTNPHFAQRSQAYITLGQAYLQLDQPTKAIEAFSSVSENSFSYLDAQWYLALAYIKLEQTENATIVLNRLLNHPSDYKKDIVKTILEGLKK